MSAALLWLQASYAVLETTPKRTLTPDQARSLAFYRAELLAEHDPETSAENQDLVSKWITNVRTLESFVRSAGRFPRTNARLPRAAAPREERVLTEWVRYQRTERARARHCSYQTLRLEAVAGFSWSPLDDAWDHQLEAYRAFVTQNGWFPRYRSEDPVERAIASWAAKQRSLIRTGRAPHHRITEFLEITARPEPVHAGDGPDQRVCELVSR